MIRSSKADKRKISKLELSSNQPSETVINILAKFCFINSISFPSPLLLTATPLCMFFDWEQNSYKQPRIAQEVHKTECFGISQACCVIIQQLIYYGEGQYYQIIVIYFTWGCTLRQSINFNWCKIRSSCAYGKCHYCHITLVQG